MHGSARTLLIVCVSMLLLLGLGMLYSTTYTAHGESYLTRQVVWIIAGTVMATACGTFLDYRRLIRRAYWWLGLFAVVLGYLALANVLYRAPFVPARVAGAFPFVAGLSKGSARWLRVFGFTVQPSEFAKLAVIIFMSSYFARHARHTAEFYRGFLKPIFPAALVTGLILLGGDLSTTAITGTVVLCLAFVGGMRLRYLALMMIAGSALLLGAIITSPERISRVTSYRHPEEVQQDAGYQLWHSQLALGSGGWRGLGFTDSRMKRYYLPEAHTDFIVAILGEELGLAGVMTLVLLYLGMTAAALWIAVLAPDRAGTLLATGIGLSLAIHAFVNISVVSGFCPTTGVTAPFISYGGSSIVASLTGIGLLLSVSRIGEQVADDRARQEQQDIRVEPLHRRRTGRPSRGS